MTMMPESNALILKRVCSTPVIKPATAPATAAAKVAYKGLWPVTSSAAATAAPKVMEPSAVISGKW